MIFYLFCFLIIFYSLGWIFVSFNFLQDRFCTQKLSLVFFFAGILITPFYFVLILLYEGLFSFFSIFFLLLLLSWGVFIFYVVLAKKISNPYFSIVLPVVGIFIFIISHLFQQTSYFPSSLFERYPIMGISFLVIHILSITIGYLLFGISSLLSFLFLFLEYKIKHKKVHILENNIPSLGWLDEFNYKVISIGFIFLGIGIVLGIVMRLMDAQKEFEFTLRLLFPIFTWFVYGFFFLSRSLEGLQRKTSAIWSILAFLVAVTSFSYEIFYLIENSM